MIKVSPKGFYMTFSNGWTVSVQFGEFNYCDNKYQDARSECANAEVAVFDRNGTFYRLTPHDDVEGYVEPDKIANIIQMVSGFTGDADEMNAIPHVHYET